MLAIGRCLMGAPELVMFDEPSLGLGAGRRAGRARDHPRAQPRGPDLRAGRAERRACRSSSPSRAYVLENGRITLSGTGAELLADDRVRQAYLGM